jgi:hypothetical protein
MASDTTINQSANPADWSVFYADLQQKGNVPDASCADINQNNAVFSSMFLDLSVIKNTIRLSGYNPLMTVIYADVLVIPNLTNWLLNSQGLVIFARRIEVAGSATILLDFRESTTAQVIIFADEFVGELSVNAIKKDVLQPVIFKITQNEVAPGVSVNAENGAPTIHPLKFKQGIGFDIAKRFEKYLNNSFIFGSLLYDQNQTLALSILLWVKSWAAQSDQFQELFYRSTSLGTLLNSQINAQENGALFVPYLTANVYTTLAQAFAADAAKYENDYQHLSTQKVLTDEAIAVAKTMVANSQSEIVYVNSLLKQANENYDNAVTAATQAQQNFNIQKIKTDDVAAKFQQIGIPDYVREQTIKAIVSLVTALVTFGAGIAAMAVGDEAAGPAAAEGAVKSVQAVEEAAGIGSEIAKTAKDLAETMKKLKKLVEALQKVYELAKAVKEVADNISSAKGQVDVIQDMEDTTDGADLSAADGWAIYKIQTDNLMKDPVEKGIGYAAEYLEAIDILVVYGQSLNAAQLAVIKTGQQAAAITFQLHYAQEKQANLQALVDNLKAGEAPILAMMQQFYQKYLDGKSSLFAALKSYQASYFYWALRRSVVQPKIVDPVSDLSAGIADITKITMDSATALEQFDPPPQQMSNILFTIKDPEILKQLHTTGQTSWVLPLTDEEFAGMERVRLNTIRVWLEGTDFNGSNHSVFITVTTTGNYLDTYKKTNYQFNSKTLTRTFKYRVDNHGTNPDWEFDNGLLGFVQIDGAVDKEVAYAYFQPTPFSEWHISLLANNQGLDYSSISKITMYFAGTAIGSTSLARKKLIEKAI